MFKKLFDSLFNKDSQNDSVIQNNIIISSDEKWKQQIFIR